MGPCAPCREKKRTSEGASDLKHHLEAMNLAFQECLNQSLPPYPKSKQQRQSAVLCLKASLNALSWSTGARNKPRGESQQIFSHKETLNPKPSRSTHRLASVSLFSGGTNGTRSTGGSGGTRGTHRAGLTTVTL